MNKNVITWDEYFMGVSMLSSLRSKDPNSRTGACIVNAKNRIVGIGYNGFPSGCPDNELPWENEGDFLDTKYPYVCHSELNAILNSSGDLDGCRMYIRTFPCNECTKAIIQSGIREVIYLHYSRPPESDIFVAARRMMDMAGVVYRKLDLHIDSAYVKDRMADAQMNKDLHKYIL